MDIGMTGRRHGITEEAMASLKQLAPSLDIKTVRHGDCVGADKQFHDFIREHNKNITIVIHPPNIKTLRAFCKGDIVEKEKPYLQRNKDIATKCELLIAFSPTKEEIMRSGTWQTIRTAKKLNKKIIIIHMDGEIEKY